MTARRVTLTHYLERVDGGESYAELVVLVCPAQPATRWDPGHHGEIEPDALRLDGVLVHLSDHSALVDAIIEAEDIPEAEEIEA